MSTQDPQVLGTPPTPSPAAAPKPPPAATPPAAPLPEPTPAAAKDPAADLEALRAEQRRDRFDAAAARAGVAEDYTEVALALFEKTGKEPTRANMDAFVAEMKKTRPALFGPQPGNTAPTPTSAAPAAPAPGTVANPLQQWQSLKSAGRHPEAEAFYLANRDAIRRSA